MPQPRNWGLGERLLKHFTDNPDEIVTVDTLAKVGKTDEERARRQVVLMRSRNVGNMARHLDTVTPGQAWRWNSEARTFEQEKSTPLARMKKARNEAFEEAVADAKQADAKQADQKIQNGADLLRDMAQKLKEGEFNVPEMIRQLEGMAIGLDVIYEEMANTDLRTLQRKAQAWDRFRQLVRDTDLYVED